MIEADEAPYENDKSVWTLPMQLVLLQHRNHVVVVSFRQLLCVLSVVQSCVRQGLCDQHDRIVPPSTQRILPMLLPATVVLGSTFHIVSVVDGRYVTPRGHSRAYLTGAVVE
jgi:hypothetical protein